MSYNPMDLDYSLDDLIKKRRTSHGSKKPSVTNKKGKSPQKQQQHQHQQQQHARPALQTNKAKVTKPSQRNINARLSTSGAVSGPLFTAKSTPQRQTPKIADPSQIIITKAIPKTSNIKSRLGNANDKKVKSVLAGRLGSQPRQEPRQEPEPAPAPVPSLLQQPKPVQINSMFRSAPSERVGELSIRGRSNTTVSRPVISIKGESGPTTILITGLDPGSNSEDLRVTLEEFGNILHCEVLRDRYGRSFGEAEVEFSTKSAALDCIAMMDNMPADGNILRVILREPKNPQTYIQKQIRSMVQPSYAASGKMYSDQMRPRYDISRQ